MSDIESLNSILQEIGNANDGVNHGSDYCFISLPAAESLKQALALHFSALYTSNSPPRPAEEWSIRAAELGNRLKLRNAIEYWFYGLEFSPKIDELAVHKVLDNFSDRLDAIVGDSTAFEVTVNPPMWYECTWQDFAFDSESKRWMLHLGFAD